MKKRKPVFDPVFQNTTTAGKIVVALERIAESFRVLLWNESKEYGLSPIQVQLLIFLQTHRETQCKVSYLAREFNMTKATISDAIRVLEEKEYIRRETVTGDSRSYILSLTHKGNMLAEKLAIYASPMLIPLENMSNEIKETTLSVLLHLIHHLHEQHIIAIQRMCFTCRYYNKGKKKGEHYCSLLDMKLTNNDLRIDCPEHEYALSFR